MFHNFHPPSPPRKKLRPLGDNVEKYCTASQDTDCSITRRMRFACWINKATDTDSEHVIFIAFPRQQWLRERASALRYVHIAYLVCTVSIVYTRMF